MMCCKKLAKEIWRLNNEPKFNLYDTVYVDHYLLGVVNICIIIGEPEIGSKKYSMFGERYFFYYYPILEISETHSFVTSARECKISNNCNSETVLNDLDYLSFWRKINEINPEKAEREDNSDQ